MSCWLESSSGSSWSLDSTKFNMNAARLFQFSWSSQQTQVTRLGFAKTKGSWCFLRLLFSFCTTCIILRKLIWSMQVVRHLKATERYELVSLHHISWFYFSALNIFTWSSHFPVLITHLPWLYAPHPRWTSMDNTQPAHCLFTKALSFTYIAFFVCCCSSVVIFHLVCYPSQKRSGTAANGMRSLPSQHSIACCAKFYKVNHCLVVTRSSKWPLASSGLLSTDVLRWIPACLKYPSLRITNRGVSVWMTVGNLLFFSSCSSARLVCFMGCISFGLFTFFCAGWGSRLCYISRRNCKSSTF